MRERERGDLFPPRGFCFPSSSLAPSPSLPRFSGPLVTHKSIGGGGGGLNTHPTLICFLSYQKASLIGIIDIPPSFHLSLFSSLLLSSVHFSSSSSVRWCDGWKEEEEGDVHSLMMAMGFLPQCSIKASARTLQFAAAEAAGRTEEEGKKERTESDNSSRRR